MISNTNSIKINDKINLYLMESNKFKTNLIGIYIKRPLNKEEATMNSLLSRILHRGTEKYPTGQSLSQKLDELYGAVLITNAFKYGEKQVIQTKLQVPNKKYLNNKDIFDEALDVLRDVLFNPLIDNGGFNNEFFEQEKKNLRQEILNLKDDKMAYSLNKCVEVMCENEPYRIEELGDLNVLQQVTPKSLYQYYKKIMLNSPIDICVIGDINREEITKKIKSEFNFKRKDVISFKREKIYFDPSEVTKRVDYMDVKQGKLCLGYRTNIGYEDPLYSASILFSNIFGGGANSKLFDNIREEKGLCYSIFSKIEKFKSIMMVYAGIESKNYQTVLELIDKNFNDMLLGNFTDQDIQIAKEKIISSLRSMTDFQNSYINFFYTHILTDEMFDIEQIIDKFKNVTKSEIIEAGKKYVLDTIYFIDKSKDGENNEH